MSYSTGYISIAPGNSLVTHDNIQAALGSWRNMESTDRITITTGEWDPLYSETQTGRIVTTRA